MGSCAELQGGGGGVRRSARSSARVLAWRRACACGGGPLPCANFLHLQGAQRSAGLQVARKLAMIRPVHSSPCSPLGPATLPSRHFPPASLCPCCSPPSPCCALPFPSSVQVACILPSKPPPEEGRALCPESGRGSTSVLLLCDLGQVPNFSEPQASHLSKWVVTPLLLSHWVDNESLTNKGQRAF